MEAILLMLVFQIKHWYVDFWIQTYQQTVGKGIYGDLVGFSHTLEQATGTLVGLLIASFFLPISVATIILIGFLDLVIHYHVDYVKMHYGIKNTATTRFWREFGLDQLAHQLTYIGFTFFIITR